MDSLILKIREDMTVDNQYFSAKPSPMDFDVDLPDLTCPDLFLISVEWVTNALINTPVTRRSVNAVTPPRPKQTNCSVTFIILCVAVTRHDFCVTPSRLIEGTAARPSYDSPTNCVTGPRRAHDRHGIIILIHDRRTTPSRRFQDLCVTLLGYIKS